MSKKENKRELLKGKVVDLVKEFIKTEGGITYVDLEKLFGSAGCFEVATALAQMRLKLL